LKYQEYIERKMDLPEFNGIQTFTINKKLYPFQRDIVAWALRRGRACLWEDCGLGKSFQQIEWAKNVPGKKLIVAPLAVAEQTIGEAEKLDVEIKYARHQSEVESEITITNYEMLHEFEASKFNGVVLDESSILKNFDGKTRQMIIEMFALTPYKLACTATPAPNDYMEIGNHSEFVGAMPMNEMLAAFFTHDGGETQKWRLKGHAKSDFWKFVCSWAVMIRKPSDLGYDDDGFILPKLHIHRAEVEVEGQCGEFLFPMEARTLQERISARKDSVEERANLAAEIASAAKGPVLIWCNLNVESDLVTKLIPDAIQVKGSDSMANKIERLNGFSNGKYKTMVTKPSIAGMGMNWQHCQTVVFLGLSDSWEQYYQAVRRCWRFGQKKEVHAHIITSKTEGAVVANIMRKEHDADQMAKEMVKNMHSMNEQNIKGTVRLSDDYKEESASGKNWTIYRGDCVEKMSAMKENSIGYSIFSPPFASLYTYSASPRDMGNCKGDADFFEHFKFMVAELYRVLKPGRLVSFHCMNMPTSKTRDGVIGIRDFRGELIRVFSEHGFIYHSEVCIWKDPVTAMQRTKALGLLWKQIKKDSCMSRQGIADYLVTMRKPGENKERVSHKPEGFPVDRWQQWASPVWMDINPSDTLQYRSAREHDDERHICPLQLEVIRRGLILWSNPGDTVLSPFAGIGSEGHEALKNGRKYIGIELKESYYKQAVANMKLITMEIGQEELITV